MIGSRNCREVGASFALQPFFLLGNQVACVFRLKDRFIILRMVSCEICGRISFQVAGGSRELIGRSYSQRWQSVELGRRCPQPEL